MIVKNLTIKLRRWPETIWEVLVPLACGVIGGVLAFDPYELPKGHTEFELLEAMTDIYFVALFMLSLSLIGSVIFLMQEMIADREKHFRESLLVMSMNNSAYQMSFFIG